MIELFVHSYQTGIPDAEINLFASKAADIDMKTLNVSASKKLKAEICTFFFLNGTYSLPHGEESERPSNGSS